MVPEARCNLLGQDLQLQLDIRVLPEEGKMVVKLLQLREEDEEKIHEILWTRPGNQDK